MTPEFKVKRKVTALLKKTGVYYFMPATHGYGRSGVPDYVACVNGAFLGIECKAPGKHLTPLQQAECEKIEKALGVVKIVRNDADIDHLAWIIEELKA